MVGFEIFDHPFTIKKLQVTKGYRDQNTGDWVPESFAETSITGNFDRGVIQSDNPSDIGIDENGEIRFYTSAGLKSEDRIKVYFDDGETESLAKIYTVRTLEQDYSWFEQTAGPSGRREYSLFLEEEDRG